MIEFIKWLLCCCCSKSTRTPNETGLLLPPNQQPSDVGSQVTNRGDAVITIGSEQPVQRSQSRPRTPDYTLLSTPPRPSTSASTSTSTSSQASSPYPLADTPGRKTPTSTRSDRSTYSLANTPDSNASGSRGPSLPTSPEKDPTSPEKQTPPRRNLHRLFGSSTDQTPVQTGMSIHTHTM